MKYEVHITCNDKMVEVASNAPVDEILSSLLMAFVSGANRSIRHHFCSDKTCTYKTELTMLVNAICKEYDKFHKDEPLGGKKKGVVT